MAGDSRKKRGKAAQNTGKARTGATKVQKPAVNTDSDCEHGAGSRAVSKKRVRKDVSR